MAMPFNPKEIDLTQINNGNKYEDGFAVGAKTINDTIEAAAFSQDKAKSAEQKANQAEQTAENNLVIMQDLQKNYEEKIIGEQTKFKGDITTQQTNFESSINDKQGLFEGKITTQQTTFEKSINDDQRAFENLIANRQQEVERELGETVSGISNVAQDAKRTAEGIDGKATQALSESGQAVITSNKAVADVVQYKNETTARVDDLSTQIGEKQGTTVYVGDVATGDVRVMSDIQGQLDSIESRMATGIEAVQLEGETIAIDTNGGAIDDLVVGMNSRQVVSPNVLPVTTLNGISGTSVDDPKKEIGIYTLNGTINGGQANPRLIDFLPVSDSAQTLRVEIMGGITTAVISRFSVYKDGNVYGAVKLNSGFGGVMTIPANTSTEFYIMNEFEVCGFTNYTFRIEVVKGNYTFENFPPYQPYTGQPATDNPIPVEDFGSVVKLNAHGQNFVNFKDETKTHLDIYTTTISNQKIKLQTINNQDSNSNIVKLTNSIAYGVTSELFSWKSEFVAKAGQYAISWNVAGEINNSANPTYPRMVVLYSDGTVDDQEQLLRENKYYVLKQKDIAAILIYTGTSLFNNVEITIQINEGATVLPYQPYQSHSAVISLTDTAGVHHTGRGSGDARDELIKKNDRRWIKEDIKVVVFDGSADECWDVRTDSPTDVVLFDIPIAGGYDYSSAISNWFGEYKPDYVGNYEHFYISDATMYIFIAKSRGITTVEQLRTYLATNNLVVNYKLATPKFYDLAATESAKLDEFLTTTYSPKTYISVANNSTENPISGYLKMSDIIDEKAIDAQLNIDGKNISPTTKAGLVYNEQTKRKVSEDIAILNDDLKIVDSKVDNLLKQVDAVKLEGYELSFDSNAGVVDSLSICGNSVQTISSCLVDLQNKTVENAYFNGYAGEQNIINLIDKTKSYTYSSMIDAKNASEPSRVVIWYVKNGSTENAIRGNDIAVGTTALSSVTLNPSFDWTGVTEMYLGFGLFAHGEGKLAASYCRMFNEGAVALPYEAYTGQPSPSNPIEIQSVASPIKIQSHNLNFANFKDEAKSHLDIYTTTISNQKIKLQTINNQVSNSNIAKLTNNIAYGVTSDLSIWKNEFVAKAGQYVISWNMTGEIDNSASPTYPRMAVLYADGSVDDQVQLLRANKYYVLKQKDIAAILIYTGTSLFNNVEMTIQINEGVEVLPYTPYEGQKTTFVLRDVNGVEHVARGLNSVRDELIKKNGRWWIKEDIAGLVLDGSADERWGVRTDNPTDVVVFDIPNVGGYDYSSAVSNWFGERQPDWAGNYEHFYISDTTMYIFIDKSRGITTVEQLRTHLATNNLTVNFKLATPNFYELDPTEAAKLEQVQIFDNHTYITATSENGAPAYLKMYDLANEKAKRVQFNSYGEDIAPATFADMVRNIATGNTVETDTRILGNKTDLNTKNLTEIGLAVETLNSQLSDIETALGNKINYYDFETLYSKKDGSYDDMAVGNAKKSTTQGIGDSSTNIATTAFVQALIADKLSFKQGTISSLSGISSYTLRKQGKIVLLDFNVNKQVVISGNTTIGYLPDGFWKSNLSMVVPGSIQNVIGMGSYAGIEYSVAIASNRIMIQTKALSSGTFPFSTYSAELSVHYIL